MPAKIGIGFDGTGSGEDALAPRGLRESPPERLATVAVAFLDTPEARHALDGAVAPAERVGARLRLVSVLPRPAEVYLPVVGRDAELLEGGVVDTLATLDRRDADLLVCGSRAYGPLRRVLLGGVSSPLLRRSALPLLVVPRSGPDA